MELFSNVNEVKESGATYIYAAPVRILVNDGHLLECGCVRDSSNAGGTVNSDSAEP